MQHFYGGSTPPDGRRDEPLHQEKPMYDAIIVGARVAGAPTAMLLARKGHRVLLLDRDTFPSDIMSTHLIAQPGVAQLGRWGLLDAVTASGCPPIVRRRNSYGSIVLDGTPEPLAG